MNKLTRIDIEDLQLSLAIVLDKPVKAAKRFEELYDKLEHFRQSWQGGDVCEWENYTDEKGYSWHETSCGHSIDRDVSPVSNGFAYCPYCAGKIKYIHVIDNDDALAESELSNDELEDEEE